MTVTSYVPGEIRLFGAGAPSSADISTLCVRANQYVVNVSFSGDVAYTYSSNSGDTGPSERRNHESTKTVPIGMCMGEKVWIKVKGGAALCRIESAPEALARADGAVEILLARLELAETKQKLAEALLAADRKEGT